MRDGDGSSSDSHHSSHSDNSEERERKREIMRAEFPGETADYGQFAPESNGQPISQYVPLR